MNKALIFPGQGSQYVGMGKSLADNFKESKEIFQRVDDALGENLSKLIWHGPDENLRRTQNTQPALMATSMASIAAARVVGFDFGNVKFAAGHSLGEYSAMCYAGAISLEDTAKILRKRGKAMQEAVSEGQGVMAAIIGIDLSKVKDILSKLQHQGVCEIANDNEPKQIVISGSIGKVQKAIEDLKEAGARRALLLPVSAPFHCTLMEPAAKVMEIEIQKLRVKDLEIPVVSNVSATTIQKSEEIKMSLIKQITHSVRWRESVSFLAKNGVEKFVEFGAGKVLSGLVRRALVSPTTINFGEFSDIKSLKE